MTKLPLLAVSYLLAIAVGLTILACGASPSQPLPTPIQPATPLPPATPVPPSISLTPATPRPAVPTTSQVQRMPRQHLYRTVNSLPGSSDTMTKLVENSSVIVIGIVPNDEPDTVRVQDQSATNVQAIGSSFNVKVERYLKGSGGDTIPVVQFYGLDYTDQGQTKQARDTNDDLLLGKRNRYLLFLRENGSYPGYWIGTAHPYKFLLEGGRVKVESPVGNLGGAIPDGKSENEFISGIESKIPGSP